jgi:poly(3-hydroxybutyrate) depolymerase
MSCRCNRGIGPEPKVVRSKYGRRTNMRLLAIAVAMLAWSSIPEAPAQTVGDLCSRATMTAAVGPITAETFSYGGVERYYCTYTSSLIGTGTQHPLVIALHGGDGNASQMMEDARHIIEHAEAMGYIAVFPNGLPRDSCGGASLCLDNSWGAPDNVFFIAELISRMKAGGQVQDDRVHLIGFSGGAKLIYNIVATPGFPHAISSIATVAGAFGLYHADRPDEGFSVIQLDQGTPVSALLAQGGVDPKAPAAGGLDETEREAHVSFRTKVDYWRLVTGTETATPRPVDVLALDPTAPADVAATRYSRGGLTVVEVLDPNLAHAWPAWDIMAVMVELFERS